jgi:hypothetical protein
MFSAIDMHPQGKISEAHRKSCSSSSLFNPALERSICAPTLDRSDLDLLFSLS